MSCLESLNLCSPAGDTFTYRILWTDSEGEPVDLTGATIEFSVTSAGTTVVYDGTPEVTVVEEDGQIDLLIAGDVTEDWLTDTTWSLRVTQGTTVTTLGRGRILVS